MIDVRFYSPGRARGLRAAPGILALALVLMSGAVTHAQAAEGTNPESSAPADPDAKPKPMFEIPRAVFVWDPANTNAVDPFFPRSDRRYKSATGPKKVVTMDRDTLAERFIFLRGITGPVGDQVALLNNQPLKVGDVFALRLEDAEGQPRGQERLTVQLLHIMDETVVFTVDGGKKEHVKQLAEYGRIQKSP